MVATSDEIGEPILSSVSDRVVDALGYTSIFIDEHNFVYSCDLPVDIAVAWVKYACPDAMLGCVRAQDITADDNFHTGALSHGWTSGLFVIVSCKNGQYVAIYKNDHIFSIYTKC